jgi:hypothetical protein
MPQTRRLERFLNRPWLCVPTAVAIGSVSALLLYGILRKEYYDYWLAPKLKAADPGLYIYPQLRYTFFDIVMLLWCLDGLIVCGTLLWNVFSLRKIAWAYRTIGLYIILLLLLLLGGSLMLYVRSRGY